MPTSVKVPCRSKLTWPVVTPWAEAQALLGVLVAWVAVRLSDDSPEPFTMWAMSLPLEAPMLVVAVTPVM
jgi:hypothetical protein